ncbi:hypothetical protein CYY_008831 [Polysphondylium violaceum]|uniref:BRCT domain-containing protein n=1 Tax=Polysphondylium violaceum TaxID=133409 RepID=A0A8J4UWZ3_9MYCE|nr:hypothetical protein CYY_008831 [Polysphondylium violaceum]
MDSAPNIQRSETSDLTSLDAMLDPLYFKNQHSSPSKSIGSSLDTSATETSAPTTDVNSNSNNSDNSNSNLEDNDNIYHSDDELLNLVPCLTSSKRKGTKNVRFNTEKIQVIEPSPPYSSQSSNGSNGNGHGSQKTPDTSLDAAQSQSQAYQLQDTEMTSSQDDQDEDEDDDDYEDDEITSFSLSTDNQLVFYGNDSNSNNNNNNRNEDYYQSISLPIWDAITSQDPKLLFRNGGEKVKRKRGLTIPNKIKTIPDVTVDDMMKVGLLKIGDALSYTIGGHSHMAILLREGYIEYGVHRIPSVHTWIIKVLSELTPNKKYHWFSPWDSIFVRGRSLNYIRSVFESKYKTVSNSSASGIKQPPAPFNGPQPLPPFVVAKSNKSPAKSQSSPSPSPPPSSPAKSQATPSPQPSQSSPPKTQAPPSSSPSKSQAASTPSPQSSQTNAPSQPPQSSPSPSSPAKSQAAPSSQPSQASPPKTQAPPSSQAASTPSPQSSQLSQPSQSSPPKTQAPPPSSPSKSQSSQSSQRSSPSSPLPPFIVTKSSPSKSSQQPSQPSQPSSQSSQSSQSSVSSQQSSNRSNSTPSKSSQQPSQSSPSPKSSQQSISSPLKRKQMDTEQEDMNDTTKYSKHSSQDTVHNTEDNESTLPLDENHKVLNISFGEESNNNNIDERINSLDHNGDNNNNNNGYSMDERVEPLEDPDKTQPMFTEDYHNVASLDNEKTIDLIKCTENAPSAAAVVNEEEENDKSTQYATIPAPSDFRDLSKEKFSSQDDQSTLSSKSSLPLVYVPVNTTTTTNDNNSLSVPFSKTPFSSPLNSQSPHSSQDYIQTTNNINTKTTSSSPVSSSLPITKTPTPQLNVSASQPLYQQIPSTPNSNSKNSTQNQSVPPSQSSSFVNYNHSHANNNNHISSINSSSIQQTSDHENSNINNNNNIIEFSNSQIPNLSFESMEDKNSHIDLSKNSKPVILGTRLTRLMQFHIISLTMALGGKYVTTWSEDVTHVVCSTLDDTKLSQRTIKYQLGISKGLWIVSFDWILESLNQNQWVNELEFEIQGDNVAAKGSPSKARQHLLFETKRLFYGYSFYLVGEFESPSKQELESVIKEAGGIIIKDNSLPPKPQNIKELLNTKSIVLCHPDFMFNNSSSGGVASSSNSIGIVNRVYLETKHHPISFKWIFDCLSHYEILSRENYIQGITTSTNNNISTQQSVSY